MTCGRPSGQRLAIQKLRAASSRCPDQGSRPLPGGAEDAVTGHIRPARWWRIHLDLAQHDEPVQLGCDGSCSARSQSDGRRQRPPHIIVAAASMKRAVAGVMNE
jgi:hypothetical protein